MWLLISHTGKLIYLKPNISVSIGRKNSDILLSHDASVSKNHASVVVKLHDDFTMSKPASYCILKDEGSKYGTYICKNGTFEKITADVHLKDQDLIRIGLQKEIFTIKYISIISMTSALQDNEKEKLLEIMNIIDGIVIADWNKYCTHLTVVKPKLTQKVAVSLAACIPIVTIDYWDAVKTTIERGDPLPETDKFIPKINEPYISKIPASLAPNCERKTLFANLTFVFFCTEQYGLHKTMIELAGGKPVLFNPNNEKNHTFEHNFIYVRYSVIGNTQLTEDLLQRYDHICKKLNTLKRRVIPDSEISLAILHCSTKQYCNSKYNFANCLRRQEKSNYNLPQTLVMDTQDQDIIIIKDSGKKQKSNHKYINYVPETIEIDSDTSMEDNETSQENIHNLKELTPEKELITLKEFFVPETKLSSSSNQRNIDSCIEQNSNYNFFKENIDSNPKKMHTPIGVTSGKKHITTLLDEYSDEQVVTSDPKEVSPSEPQICIPETINENDSNDVIIRNEIRKDEEDMFITTRNVSQPNVTENIQSYKNNGRRKIIGKTFKKEYIKIPEKRIRLL